MKNNRIMKIFFFLTVCVGVLTADVLTLSKAYDLALENSNTIKSSQYQYEAKKERVEQVKSELYPQINTTVSYSDTDFEYNNLRTYDNYFVTEKSTDYTVSLSQVLYNPEITSRLEAEKSRIKMFNVGNELKKQELAQSVLKAYLDILKSNNKITLLESYVEYNKFQLDLLEKRFKMNLSSKMDFLKAKVDYHTATLELTKEINLREVFKVKLTNIIGKTNFIIPTFDAYTLKESIFREIYSKIEYKSTSSSNLEIQQAQYGVEVSKKNIENAYTGDSPKVNLDLAYTQYDSNSYTTDYENSKRVMISLKIPLYRGGYVSSKVAESMLNFKAANADLDEISNEIDARYDELYAAFKSSVESVKVYQETLKSTQLYLDAVSMGVDNGLKSVVDVYDAKYKLNEVKYKYVENIYTMMDSYIGLLIVTNNFSELKVLDTILTN